MHTPPRERPAGFHPLPGRVVADPLFLNYNRRLPATHTAQGAHAYVYVAMSPRGILNPTVR